MTTVGFTGTRNGMTEPQRQAVRGILMAREPSVCVHGDCVGADADFDGICQELGIERTCRPCTFESMRAHTGAREVAEPKRPMARNRDIVADADFMIACPPNFERIKKGSGTWATIGFAERAQKELFVIFPDGRISRDTDAAPANSPLSEYRT